MICSQYAHCTWEHYQTVMPADEKVAWRLYIRNEGRRAEMRKTEEYKQAQKTQAPDGEPLVAAVDAPDVLVLSDLDTEGDG